MLWTNTLRVTPGHLGGIFPGEGLAADRLSWEPSTFRLPAYVRMGDRWWYLGGLAHCQKEASLLPVRLLDPQPGEGVLDVCAAPGGKTAQIAVALGGRGTVLANDISHGRSRALRATIERLGLANVSTTMHDGACSRNPGKKCGLVPRAGMSANQPAGFASAAASSCTGQARALMVSQ